MSHSTALLVLFEDHKSASSYMSCDQSRHCISFEGRESWKLLWKVTIIRLLIQVSFYLHPMHPSAFALQLFPVAIRPCIPFLLHFFSQSRLLGLEVCTTWARPSNVNSQSHIVLLCQKFKGILQLGNKY